MTAVTTPSSGTRVEPNVVDILLVDDHPENLVALQAILTSPTYRLVSVTSGEEALAALLRRDFALVLLDVVMPGMDGFEVAHHMKQLERTRRIPILFLTAVATDVSHIFEAYSIGAVDYLIKPLDTCAVRSKVEVFVDLYRQRFEIERQAHLLREADRREHELRLAEVRVASDERYRKLVEGIDHTVGWSMTPDALELTFVSRQLPRVLGYSTDQFTKPGFWLECIPPEDRPLVRETFRRAREDRVDQRCHHRIIATDGRMLWFQTGVSVLADAAGKDELHGIFVDVTPMKQAEEEAKMATQARDEILALVSHDLRNLLNSITLGVERLRQARLGDVPGKVVDVIYRAARRMERMVTDLVDFEQIKLKRLRIDKGPQSVASLLAETIDLLEPIACEAAVMLDVEDNTAGDVDVICDRERILQALSNLVGNAIKFSPRGSRVTLAGRRAGAVARIEVVDRGPGLPPEQLPHVFDRFWKGANTTSSGLGLGLAIVKGIVEAHGGEVGVASTLGEGTTFFFTLPLVAPNAGEASS